MTSLFSLHGIVPCDVSPLTLRGTGRTGKTFTAPHHPTTPTSDSLPCLHLLQSLDDKGGRRKSTLPRSHPASNPCSAPPEKQFGAPRCSLGRGGKGVGETHRENKKYYSSHHPHQEVTPAPPSPTPSATALPLRWRGGGTGG